LSKEEETHHGLPCEDTLPRDKSMVPDFEMELNGKKVKLSFDSVTDWIGFSVVLAIVGSVVGFIAWVAI